MEKGLLEKTGKSLAEWKKIVKATSLEKHGEIMKYLKSEHGLTHGFANFITLKYREADAGSHDATDLVNAQYSKGKEVLFPIYEKLKAAISAFGDDIEFVPKKANVSVRRKKQFALIQPSTKTRMDLGLKIKGKEPAGRLETSGPFGSMCTHRVRLGEAGEVDGEVLAWLKEAYEMAD
ncbi:MAG: DUF4287 domain-containing protein [Saprospiraceae bacterium]|nr:DUF4287 domain-containing protein [Saprospiraceae bacterium]